MRREISGIFLALAATAAAAQSDPGAARFDENAKAVVSRLEQGLRIVKPSAKGNGFVRTEWRLTGPAAVDVKRTDSVLEPIRATVELPVQLGMVGAKPTEAEASETPVSSTEDFRIQAVYLPANGGWRMKSVRYFVKGLGSWMTGPGVVSEVTSLFEVPPTTPSPTR